MKATHLIVLRHGQTLWNRENRLQGQQDSPLTDLGLKQTAGIVKRLADHQSKFVYTSDLSRAHIAAKKIAEIIGATLRIDDRLREQNYGIFEGLTRAEMKEKYLQEFSLFKSRQPDFAIPGGESKSNFFERSVACFEELSRKHAGEQVIVVTHLGVLDNLFRYILNIPLDAPRKFKSLEGSFHSVYFKSRKWVIETWGDVSHVR